MKTLKLKIWVEDEDGKIQSSQQFAGGLPVAFKEPNLIELNWTNNSRELDYKILINSVAVLLKAKYGDEYIDLLPDASAHLKKELGI